MRASSAMRVLIYVAARSGSRCFVHSLSGKLTIFDFLILTHTHTFSFPVDIFPPLKAFSTMCTSSSSVTSLLRNPSLLPEHPDDGSYATYPVSNPADPSSTVGHVRLMDHEDAKVCIEKSENALESWRDGTTASERSSLLSAWSRLITENAEDIATIMTLESGKPMLESRGEVAYGTSFLDYYAGEAVRPTGAGGGFLVPTPFTDSSGAPRGQLMAIQQAVGVTAMITPWNFPLAMITRKVGPALAAGCTCIVKPSEKTPLTAIAAAELAKKAGIPEDVFQLVTPDFDATARVGKELCTNPAVQKISFTGSVPVGKQLFALCGDTVKRLSLELGGNAPFLVFADADLDVAVDALASSKFRNCGQTCVCADRILIHADIFDEFVKKLVERVEGMKVGPGMDDSTTMGPLITANALSGLHAKVQAALADSASCVIGGSPLKQLGPNFYEPTVLTDVKPETELWKTETFGPVAALCKFDTEEEALRLANDCNVGLAGYFCTRDLDLAFRFARR